MTAKEYLQSQKMFDGGKLERMLEEYAKIKWDEACKAQRKECAKNALYKTKQLTGIDNQEDVVCHVNQIKNAPKPEYR